MTIRRNDPARQVNKLLADVAGVRSGTDGDCLSTIDVHHFLLGVVPAQDAVRVESHLATCRQCNRRVEALVNAVRCGPAARDYQNDRDRDLWLKGHVVEGLTREACMFVKRRCEDTGSIYFTHVNEAFLKILANGRSREEVIGKTDKELNTNTWEVAGYADADSEIFDGKKTRVTTCETWQGIELHTIKAALVLPSGEVLVVGVATDDRESALAKLIHATEVMQDLLRDVM